MMLISLHFGFQLFEFRLVHEFVATYFGERDTPIPMTTRWHTDDTPPFGQDNKKSHRTVLTPHHTVRDCCRRCGGSVVALHMPDAFGGDLQRAQRGQRFHTQLFGMVWHPACGLSEVGVGVHDLLVAQLRNLQIAGLIHERGQPDLLGQLSSRHNCC